MSLLNLALQGARRSADFEDQLKPCNNMKQICLLAAEVAGLKDAIYDSLESPKTP